MPCDVCVVLLTLHVQRWIQVTNLVLHLPRSRLLARNVSIIYSPLRRLHYLLLVTDFTLKVRENGVHCYELALLFHNGHETLKLETETRPRPLPPETETRPRRWPHQPRRNRDETLVRLETEASRPRPHPWNYGTETGNSTLGFRLMFCEKKITLVYDSC